jgi:glycosyltransferase involved in cell wall biosynthesis
MDQCHDCDCRRMLMESPIDDGDGVLMVRAPHAQASVHYRAYIERLESGTVLDWVFRRLWAALPPGLRLICVCDTDTERDRVRAATNVDEPTEIVSASAPSEAHLCRLVMDRYELRRLAVAHFCHAIAPARLIRNLVSCHKIAGADLTSTTDATFSGVLFVVESSLVNEVLSAGLPNLPTDFVSKAKLLWYTKRQSAPLIRGLSWLGIVPDHVLGIHASEWPEKVSLESARDVDILREALAATTSANGHLLDAWKQAAIGVRQSRLSAKCVKTVYRVNRRSGRRRILYGSNASGFTGAQQSLCHLIGALDRTRYEPLALVSNSGTFTDELLKRDVVVICPEESIASGDPENVVRAKHVLETYSPDLIHANHNIGMPLTAAALAAGVPLVQHVRVQAPRALGHQIYTADAVIAVSEFVRQRVAELDVDLRKVEVIWNGVDLEQFDSVQHDAESFRTAWGIPSDEIVVTMIARMARNKRHDVVTSAFGRMRFATGRGHLLLVGGPDGDWAYYHAVRAQIEREGLLGHVVLVEFIADVRSALRATDILAIPSSDEPLSRAALEGMAAGLPVIVGDEGGTKEVIDHGRTGFVVRCGDVANLTTVLCELAEHPERRAAIGRAAAEYVRNTLTARHCAMKTMDLYERVLSGSFARQVRLSNPGLRWPW